MGASGGGLSVSISRVISSDGILAKSSSSVESETI
jgi:hypothetical protein